MMSQKKILLLPKKKERAKKQRKKRIRNVRGANARKNQWVSQARGTQERAEKIIKGKRNRQNKCKK